jgi:hypothetical protein
MVPGRAYAITYDGRAIAKEKVELIIAPIAKQHNLTFTVDAEESVSFP